MTDKELLSQISAHCEVCGREIYWGTVCFSCGQWALRAYLKALRPHWRPLPEPPEVKA